MKLNSRLSGTLFFTIILLSIRSLFAQSPVDYVDPFLGSVHSRWFFFTPACEPLGMVKLAPMTYGFGGYRGGGHVTGYDYNHNSIIGFCHVHEFQLGGILTMPTVGKLYTVPGDENQSEKGFRSGFSKENEQAEAGYYSVYLDKYKVKVELTATTRVGFHRYTFPASDSAHILFDVGHLLGEAGGIRSRAKTDIIGAGIKILDNQRLEGYSICKPDYQSYSKQLGHKSIRIYFAAEISKAAKTFGCYRDDIVNPGMKAEYGKGCGAYLSYETKANEIIEMKVAISYVSQEQAWINLKIEGENIGFDKVRENTHLAWNKTLSKIEVEGGSEEDKTKFYTALYHVMLGRGISSDANGKYISNRNDVKQIKMDDGVPAYNHHNFDGLWGSYWNLMQLWTMVYPEFTNSLSNCLLDIYDETGWLPDGVVCDKYVPGVESNHSSVLLSSAFQRGIAHFDVEKAFEAAYKNETGWEGRPRGVGRSDNGLFWEYGYCPVDMSPYNGPSHTLENCFTNWATAQFAKKLNKNDAFEKLMKGAKNYVNMYDKEVGFLNSRKSDGTFQRPFSPWNTAGFEEGSIWQYTWYVPHDIDGLMGLMGKDRVNHLLDSTLTVAEKDYFSSSKGENTGAYGSIYNHGNQPGLQTAWLFNYTGKPWLTQKWTRSIMNRFYGSTPEHGYGFGQDEDQGQLGAWFVLAAIGMFDVQGGAACEPMIGLGSPLFDRIIIHLDSNYYDGDTFQIIVKNNSSKNIYIKQSWLNGKPLSSCFVEYKTIVKGGKLVLEMNDVPNMKYNSFGR